jgi:hypothetical protein
VGRDGTLSDQTTFLKCCAMSVPASPQRPSRMESEPSNGRLEAAETTALLPNEPPEPIDSASIVPSIKLILLSSPVNSLLVFLPFALLSGYLEWSPPIIFLTNFFAMMPLAALLSFTTDNLSRRTGEALGGFLNVTFGNIMELIIGIVALRSGQIILIQTTMLGSMLSNLLFVSLSLCYFLSAANCCHRSLGSASSSGD